MKALLVFLSMVFLTSLFGAFFRPGPWYDELIKPALTPPGWIFTPVWLTLYVMIAISGWLTWIKTRSIKNKAMLTWGLQLVTNAMWSMLFFGLQSPLIAFFNIFILLILIVLYIKYSYPVSKKASLLFVPYALWVGFAAYLNLGLVILN
ncbi:TspO/MBR family protein [Desulfonatronovibrio magnus]|uniref:TspO/MBR family protein n=1 Tax=Desulfonatronovibrio magnus TaxID=698827 RepID=UPI0005EAD2A3|nr:TspO/MBR family protein [Desulfonatronovibrio magnus]